ncbi:hypothetical protein LR48_Vigan09g167000 [Vigna angularis]|uniref:Uncharacterized protein n=1 Tax=Phaseolus angularis TaxID=3914 RepID=A0A0L9VD77_PHAAN|nr:hypothetical protein LR48_Vigan09g167000 [Vigna angularis]
MTEGLYTRECREPYGGTPDSEGWTSAPFNIPPSPIWETRKITSSTNVKDRIEYLSSFTTERSRLKFTERTILKMTDRSKLEADKQNAQVKEGDERLEDALNEENLVDVEVKIEQ